MENIEKIILTITLEYMKFKSQLYGLNKKIETVLKNGFRFSEIVKLKLKKYSSLSNINRHYYLKHRIPIMHRQFFRIISQTPEYLRTNCNDLKNPFSFCMSQMDD